MVLHKNKVSTCKIKLMQLAYCFETSTEKDEKINLSLFDTKTDLKMVPRRAQKRLALDVIFLSDAVT